jgi:hypothetical protein
MQLQDAIKEALKDPEVTDRIEAQAKALLARDSLETPEDREAWEEFLNEFRASPEELVALTTPRSVSITTNTPGIPTIAYLLANAAASSAVCNMTTTTTTTSLGCPELLL